jgi:hypothetical protein
MNGRGFLVLLTVNARYVGPLGFRTGKYGEESDLTLPATSRLIFTGYVSNCDTKESE